ncbi:MAG: phosphotransferase [Candidatus Dormibacteraceae bacterium]
MAPGPRRLIEAVERLVGSRVVGVQPRSGGWSVSVRGVVELADGRHLFAKLGDVPDTAAAVSAEIGVYRMLGARPYLPKLVAADPAIPLLVIEDLGAAIWPPPWTPALLAAFDRLCEELAATTAPAALPALPETVAGEAWERVAVDPAPAGRVIAPGWIERHLAALLTAQRRARAEGTSVVHGDLRSDNLAFSSGRAIAVDWNLARRGDGRWNRLLAAHTIHLEGGGSLDRLAPGADSGIVTWLAGFFASRVGLPAPQGAPRVRPFQLAQLRVVLPWACSLLGLEPPSFVR